MKNINNCNKPTILIWLTSLSGLIILYLSGSVIATETTAIHVAVTTHLGDGQHFREGDEISLLLSLDKDAYVLLVYQDASGKLTQLFPVRKNDNGLVPAGDFIPLPPRADGLRLIVAPPFGEERAWVFAATKAFPARLPPDIPDIKSLRTWLRRSDIFYREAYTRLTTYAGQ